MLRLRLSNQCHPPNLYRFSSCSFLNYYTSTTRTISTSDNNNTRRTTTKKKTSATKSNQRQNDTNKKIRDTSSSSNSVPKQNFEALFQGVDNNEMKMKKYSTATPSSSIPKERRPIESLFDFTSKFTISSFTISSSTSSSSSKTENKNSDKVVSDNPFDKQRLQEGFQKQQQKSENTNENTVSNSDSTTATKKRYETKERVLELVDISGVLGLSLNDYRINASELLKQHDVPESISEVCLSADQLPQTFVCNRTGAACTLLRCPVKEPASNRDLVQALTTRLCIIILPAKNIIVSPEEAEKQNSENEKNQCPTINVHQKIITLHRRPISTVDSILGEISTRYRHASDSLHLINAFYKRVAISYTDEMTANIAKFDALEARLFALGQTGQREQRAELSRSLYSLKRRSAVCSRLLVMTSDSYQHLLHAVYPHVDTLNDAYSRDVIQHLVYARSLAENLCENCVSTLQLLFQLSSYSMNSMMRVLAKFSSFFSPLIFFVSIYGMNFHEIPLSRTEDFPLWCILLGSLASSLFFWFKFKF